MKTQFDKIYVISLITNKSRQEFIKYQFDQLGLDFEFIYGIDFYNFKNVKFPNIFENMENEIQDNPKDFSCAITHYSAVMQAYHLGYNNVLVFEDDVCLNTDKELIYDMLNNVPTDADFIDYDPRCWNEEVQNNIINHIKDSNDNYVKLNGEHRLCGAAMYGIMNRNSMKLYLDAQHNHLLQSDWVENFWTNCSVKRYIPTKCLFIDQLIYNSTFVLQEPNRYMCYDNLYLKLNTYNENDFFKPDIFHIFSRC